MATLHTLDAEPVTAAVRAAAPTVPWTIDDLMASLEADARALGRRDLALALRDLARRRVAEGPTVVCHGDLHPFNVLVDDRGDVTVVDWTAAFRAEPAYDVAFTSLLLANPPLDAPGVLGRAVAPIGGLIARRFQAAYSRAHPAARLDRIDWYQALHGIRVHIVLESLRARHGDGVGHPFRVLEPAATAAIARETGTLLDI
jgi:aminoglycoside phosphotransferase (APT) family kinase protein